MQPHRILIVDDNEAVHRDFHSVLAPPPPETDPEFEDLDRLITGNVIEPAATRYRLDSAYQGREALDRVKDAAAAGDPYAVVFMDVRMPPGWDGIETVRRLWQERPATEVVICTAFCDHDWEGILTSLGESDRLQFLRKPFDPITVQQMTLALSKKWLLDALAKGRLEELESLAGARTRELREAVSQLEARNEELAEAKRIADRASDAKTVFVACMSHEIRTPLNGVLGATQLLADLELDSSARALVDIATSSGEALRGVLDKVLDTAKIEAGQIEIEDTTIAIHEIAEQACRVSLIQARSNGVSLDLVIEPGVPDEMRGDPTRFRQILLNLVGNAVKFTQQGRITVRVATAEGSLRVEVEDSGIGIPAESLEKIFAPFSQADSSTTRRFGGSGLGLYISRRLAGLMNGSLTARSEPAVGSTFRLMLPIREPRERQRVPIGRAASVQLSDPVQRELVTYHLERIGVRVLGCEAFRRTDVRVIVDADIEASGWLVTESGVRTLLGDTQSDDRCEASAELDGMEVLLVDDVRINLEIAKRIVECYGARVTCANGGRAALELVDDTTFDVILMDCQMPDLDGFETTRRMIGKLTNPPTIIAMTADSTQETRDECLRCGMTQVLVKPLRKGDVVDALRLVDGRAGRRERT